MKKLNSVYQSDFNKYNTGTKVTTVHYELPTQESGTKTIRVFSGRLGSDPSIPSKLLGYVLDKGTLFVIKISFEKEKKDLATTEFNRLIDSISARGNNTIPKEKGIYKTNGFIKDDRKKKKKSTNTLPFDLSGYPSVKISLEAEAFAKPQVDLITRVKSNLKERGIYSLTTSSFKTIRKGNKNQTGGDPLTGQEWLSQAPMQGQNGAIATWEHAGTVQNALDPAIQLDVDSGFDGNNIKTSSLHEKETIQLYEFILNSIKKF